MKRILPVFAIAIAIAAAACGKSEPAGSSSAASSPAAAAAPAPLVHASQTDLASDITEAARLATWSDVQQRWQGQKLRWTVTRYPQLCHSAERCNVAAFPMGQPAKQGWMPVVSFAPGQYDAMAAACGNREQCDLTIEGTLSELDVSADLPTKVVLSNVRLASAERTAQR